LRAIAEILTIGHSTHELEQFVELLHGAGVDLLVDVRQVPVSRRMPWFAGDSLSETLPGHGVDYAHERRLGGFRKPRPGTPNTGWEVEAFRGYADHMGSVEFAAGLAHTEQLARERRVALMCAEAQYTSCHRRLTSDALLVRGWDVFHVGPDGAQRLHVLTEFAVVSDNAPITYPSRQVSLDV
jgi:uncharacterized protein (DUF488 family)